MPGEINEEWAVEISEWPRPAIVAEPRICADDSSLTIRYRTPDDKFVVMRFPHCMYFVFGLPNDEALGGHPLGERGLEFYSVHEVEHSSLIEMLERRNSVHPRHDRELFLRGMKHYVFTFQDSTLECVFTESEWWKPGVKVFDSEIDAERELLGKGDV